MKYGSDWPSIVQTFGRVWFKLKKKPGRELARYWLSPGREWVKTDRVKVQTIFNSKEKGQVQISTLEYG